MKTIAVWTLLLALLSLALPLMAADGARLAFLPAGPGEFRFDTGVLKGSLGGQKAKGLSSVVHIPSGTRLDASMGLLSHYRVFSSGKRYGTGAWDWPAECKLEPDGSVVMYRRASDDRPFDFTAVYRLAAPDTIDLETIVNAKTDLNAFESFVANYFTKAFTNALVWAGPGSSAGPDFASAEVVLGQWQAFPRDAIAAGIIRDGRWKLEPNPVDWTIRNYFVRPAAVRAAPALGLAGILMSKTQDCFAICTPHQTEAHYSMYLSLFGKDLKTGQTERAHVRLTVVSKFTESTARRAFAEFSRSR